MQKNDLIIKEKLCSSMKELYSQQLLTDIGGNISCRAVDTDSIWITPSGVRKDRVTPEDLFKVSLDGTILTKPSENSRPSVELILHLTIYEEDEDYNAVVHTHGPYITAYSIAPVDIPPLTYETQLLVGDLKDCLVPYAPSGSKELANAVSENITDSGIAIMQNHGLIVAASSLDHAIVVTRAVEEKIRIYSITRQLGGKISPYPE